MTDRAQTLVVIPENNEAERNAIEVIVAFPSRIGELVQEGLTPEDFFVPLYRKLYLAALRLEDEHRPIEPLTLADVLADDRDLMSAGGMAFLATLGCEISDRANLREYCRLVKKAAQRRQLQRIFERAGQNVIDPTVLVTEILQQTEAELLAVREGDSNAARTAVHLSEVAREVAPVLDRVGSGNGGMLGTSTGFPDLDRITSGWIPSEMILLAGRPSAGKTALALELALRQARQGKAVAMFSLEMNRASVFLRLACRDAGVSYSRVCSGFMSRSDLRALCAAIPRISKLPFWIDDRPALSSQDLRWRLRSLARRHPIKFCVVDYLQLLRAKAENRTQEVTKISLDLKAAARELGEATGGTLLAAAQLNRAGANERPRLHHLRESGQLEQDADAVFLLSDEEPTQNGRPKPSIKLLDVAKQRNGPTDIVRLTFLPLVMGFEQADTEGREVADGKIESAGLI